MRGEARGCRGVERPLSVSFLTYEELDERSPTRGGGTFSQHLLERGEGKPDGEGDSTLKSSI